MKTIIWVWCEFAQNKTSSLNAQAKSMQKVVVLNKTCKREINGDRVQNQIIKPTFDTN